MKKKILLTGTMISVLLPVTTTLSCGDEGPINPYKEKELLLMQLVAERNKITDLNSTKTIEQINQLLKTQQSTGAKLLASDLGIDLSPWKINQDYSVNFSVENSTIRQTQLRVKATIFKTDNPTFFNELTGSSEDVFTYKYFIVNLIDNVGPTISLDPNQKIYDFAPELVSGDPNIDAKLKIKQDDYVTKEMIKKLFKVQDNTIIKYEVDLTWPPDFSTVKVASFNVIAQAQDNLGNRAKDFVLKLEIVDLRKPIITLDTTTKIGNTFAKQELEDNQGSLTLDYLSPVSVAQIQQLFSAHDDEQLINYDQLKFNWSETFDTSIAKSYQLEVTVEDNYHNHANYLLTVTVKDPLPAPTFNFDQERVKIDYDKQEAVFNSNTFFFKNKNIDFFNFDLTQDNPLIWATVDDYVDQIGALIPIPYEVKVKEQELPFDGQKPGTYYLTLTAQAPDLKKQESSFTLKVIIEDATPPAMTINEDLKFGPVSEQTSLDVQNVQIISNQGSDIYNFLTPLKFWSDWKVPIANVKELFDFYDNGKLISDADISVKITHKKDGKTTTIDQTTNPLLEDYGTYFFTFETQDEKANKISVLLQIEVNQRI